MTDLLPYSSDVEMWLRLSPQDSELYDALREYREHGQPALAQRQLDTSASSQVETAQRRGIPERTTCLMGGGTPVPMKSEIRACRMRVTFRGCKAGPPAAECSDALPRRLPSRFSDGNS
jgi:hypothetical protein